jgi:hypothetical protein
MPNGDNMIKDLEFEKQIETWSDPDKYMARKLYDIKNNCQVCTAQLNSHELKLIDQNDRLKAVESCTTKPTGSTKQTLAVAGTGGGIAGIAIAALYALAQLLGWIK